MVVEINEIPLRIDAIESFEEVMGGYPLYEWSIVVAGDASKWPNSTISGFVNGYANARTIVGVWLSTYGCDDILYESPWSYVSHDGESVILVTIREVK